MKSPNKIPKSFLNKEQKIIFLLTFTRELIRNSGEELFLIEKSGKGMKEKTPKIKNPPEAKINETVKKELMPEKNSLKNAIKETENLKPKVNIQRPPVFRVPVLRVPAPRLPPQFQYLKPTPTEKEIDLGKLNQWVNDYRVREIICQGPNQEIFLVGSMGSKPTDISLTKEEIDNIINIFSQASRIPTFEGLYKVVVGKLILSAIISEQGSRFTIRKMTPMPRTGY